MRSKQALSLTSALLLLVAILTGCSSDSSASAQPVDASQPYGITFSVDPAAPQVNEKTALTISVAQGKTKIKNAGVVLEIWPKGADASGHYQTNAKSEGNGDYVLKGQFAEKGVYYLIAHVTPSETGQMTMASFDFEIK